jgi:hypothetical protein
MPAAFAEWDGLAVPEVLGLLQELGASGLPDPTLVLVSWEHGSVHVWWRFDTPAPVERWRALMRRLVLCLGSDRTCINPSRAIRLAGSLYIQKAGKPRDGEVLGVATILQAAHRDQLPGPGRGLVQRSGHRVPPGDERQRPCLHLQGIRQGLPHPGAQAHSDQAVHAKDQRQG